MKIERFEDIIAWKKSKELVVTSYRLVQNLHDYDFRSQFLRSAVSIMNNIAEGFERLTDKDFRNFLFIAKGSCGEFRSMIYLARELKYINVVDCDNLINQSEEISRILSGLIKTLRH